MIIEKLKRFVFDLEDRLFDLRHHINTRGILPSTEVDASGYIESKDHASAYHAVWCRTLRVLIKAARVAGTQKSFVDIGAGKGKACFYAAHHFNRVIGVEYSNALIAIANENLRKTGQRNIEFILADATHFDIPDVRSLIFLFNPFDGTILDKFVKRNLSRIISTGSLVAYANDLHREVLVRFQFDCIFRDPARHLSLWRKQA